MTNLQHSPSSTTQSETAGKVSSNLEGPLAKQVGQIIPRILGTEEFAEQVQTTETPRSESKYASKLRNPSPQWKANWVKQRLGLEPYHADVALLEDAVFRVCQGVAANPGRGKRLVMYGNNGNGKSRACRAMKRFIADRAMDLPLVMRNDNAALVECILVHWPSKVDRFKTGDWDIDDLLETDLLLLDDFGAEHDPSKAGLEKMYLILERREWKWTVLTTNVSPEFWEERFERRIADRLFRNCEHVDLSNLPSYSTQ